MRRMVGIVCKRKAASALAVATLRHCVALGLLILATPAWGQWNLRAEYCNEDGVTETPSFGTRDGSNCLNVDPGNGDSVVRIQEEVFHRRMVPGGCGSLPSGYIRASSKPDWSHPNCENGCSSILWWDSTLDGYASDSCQGKDGITTGGDYGIEIFWIKDSTIANTWKCDGANAWSGPNGTNCSAGEDNSAHTDGIQLYGGIDSNGWFIMQDSAFYNGYNLHGLFQNNSATADLGNVMFQGLEFGRKERVLEANTWITDCLRGFAANNGNPGICTTGTFRIYAGYKEVWIIDSWSPSNTVISAANSGIGKIVVVNSGCSRSGCGGTIGYNSEGWPHPLDVANATGTGTCPNGQIRSSNPPVYCYTSVERAAAAHKLPPFTNRSSTGWANAPIGTTARPFAPVLQP